MHVSKHWALAALAITAVSIAPNRSRSQSPMAAAPKQIDTTFAFSKGGTVLLGNGAAQIVVMGWDQQTVQINAKAEGGIKLEASSMKLVVAPVRPLEEAIIKVMVPRGVSVIARSGSGSITIKETRGDVDIESAAGKVLVIDAHDVEATNLSGDLDVRQVMGSVTLTTNSGDCALSEIKGNIDASSVSGDVRITRSYSRIVRAEITNGTVSFEGAVHDGGRYEFLTHSGAIWLTIPKMANAHLGVTTLNGTVESDFPFALRPGFMATNGTSTKRFSFTLGQGLARVTAETFSGNVSITAMVGK